MTESVSAVDALVTLKQIAEPKLALMEDPRNLRPKEKVLEIARMKKQRLHKMCHWGTLIWGLLRYYQTTVMRWMLMNHKYETTETFHRDQGRPGTSGSRGQKR